MENSIHIEPVSFVTCKQCHVELDTEGLPLFSTIICPQCGVEAVVCGQLGNFMLTRLLGSGGMGAVYEAWDNMLNRAVAIKIMAKHLGEDQEFLNNFLREAQAAARINHPSVVQVYSFGQEGGMPYIVMELVTGGSFAKLIENRGGKIDAGLALRIGLEVAEGLKAASADGLVHGDVKPENILLDDNGLAKLVDFGIASVTGNKSAEIWGTPYYIAPEKVRRQKTDFRSDIYSLGATLFHAIAGVPPFEGKDSIEVVKARLNKPAPNLATVMTSVDAEAAGIIARMLQAEPAARYPTYESLIGDMRRYVEKAAPKNTISKRVVIKGKSVASAQSSTGNLPATGPIPANDASAAPKKKGIVLQRGIRAAAVAATTPPPAVEVEAEPGAPKKKSNTLLTILIVGLVVFVLLIVGVIGAAVYFTNVAAQKEAERIAAQEAEFKRFSDAFHAASKKAVSLNTRNQETLAAATNTAQRVSEMVVGVYGALFNRDQLMPKRNSDPDEDPETFSGDTLGIVPKVRALNRAVFTLEDAIKRATALSNEINENLFILDDPTKIGAISNTVTTITNRITAYENDETFGLQAVANAAQFIEDTAKIVEKETSSALDEKARLREIAAREEAEKKAEAERRAEDNARRMAIAGEQTRVSIAAARTIEQAKEFDFAAARRTLREIHDLQHDEAIADLALANNRIDRLEAFQKFLIDRLSGYQPPGQNWRVNSANARTLTIDGKEIRWAALEPIRMFTLTTSLIPSNEKENNRLPPLRERANMRLNAALYLNLYMRTLSPFILQEENRLRDAALKDLPSLETEAEKLLGPRTE